MPTAYSGTSGNDTIDAVLIGGSSGSGGTGQVHVYAKDGNDFINMRFGQNIPAFDKGHHVRGDNDEQIDSTGNYAPGEDIFNFKDIDIVSSGDVVVGRLEDFDFSRDKIYLEGVELDLYALPSNVRIVDYEGGHNDAGAATQQWLLIETSTGGHIFYALEGARVDINGNGGANGGDQEDHFLKSSDIPDFSTLQTVDFIDPVNFLPSGVSADGGITVNDYDSDDADVVEIILGSPNGDLIAAGLNDDTVRASGGNDRVLGGSGGDSVEGGSGNDSLFGGNRGDTLRGDEGDDILNGDAGDDFMVGGEGSDTFHVNSVGDVVKESSSWSGYDVVWSSVDFRMGQEHIEDLYLSGGAILGVGNGLENQITGNNQDNILDGKKNNDTLIGGLGDDRYYVQNAGDQVIEQAGEGLDTVLAFRSYLLAQNIENLFVQTVYDQQNNPVVLNGIGNSLDNTIVGNPFENTIIGRAGNDTLRGQAGSDTFVFDRVFGPTNVDRIVDFNTNEANEGDLLKFKSSLLGGGLTAGLLSADNFVQGTQASDADDRFVFDQSSGELWFDVDGTGASQQFLLATFDQNASVEAANIEIF
ncbi:calcium-binding protein [Roseovarius aestuariivivens]|uniref:calcium-binding protein n=1 Tax=Roseovarius aestuariivivens TaxID=1888910 RepID=UPI001080C5DB|nr:calcium-binding protein [Roseovarius aestuariivivens]